VVGVVVIVLLVVHLTKTGNNNAAGGATTSPSATATAAAGPTSQYEFTEAAKAGSYPLNSAASRSLAQLVKSTAASVGQQIKAKGAGDPGKDVVAVYDLTSVSDPSASDFKAVDFVGFDGTFKPAEIIKYEQAQLVSTRMVPAGPHGGEMMCGYSRATGSDASECLWVTNTTFGQVEFTVGQTPIKYPGASSIALAVREAVEVPAS
jgi:hypothetical protein